MSLLHRLEHARDALTWEGDMPTQGLYTAGVAGEKFLRAIKERGKLLGVRCVACGITYVPPRLYCEQCFAYLEDEAWVELPGSGQVHTFTVLHLGLDGDPLPKPRIMAFIQLDGATGGLIHYLDQVAPEHICIGLPVEAVFKEPAERSGSILDIAYFRPI